MVGVDADGAGMVVREAGSGEGEVGEEGADGGGVPVVHCFEVGVLVLGVG